MLPVSLIAKSVSLAVSYDEISEASFSHSSGGYRWLIKEKRASVIVGAKCGGGIIIRVAVDQVH